MTTNRDVGPLEVRGYGNLGEGMNALYWHLRHNFMPPAHGAIDCAEAAIEAAEVGDFEREITAPNGRTFPAWSVIEELRLEDFIPVLDWD